MFETLEGRALLATFVVPSAAYMTVMQAQEVAQDGDKIEVHSTTENITITKGITLAGVDGATIRGASGVKLPVISIENVDAVIEDLVIELGENGGIVVTNASPIIRRNDIHSNIRETRGAGIDVLGADSNPQIYGNKIHDNRHYQGAGHAGGFGGGIAYQGGNKGVIANNDIFDDEAWNTGAAVYVDGGAPEVSNNRIHDNVSDFGQAIVVATQASDKATKIFQNVINENRYDFVASGSAGIAIVSGNAEIINNTIVDNFGSGVVIGSGASQCFVVNNVIANNSQVGLQSDAIITSRYNDIWNNSQGDYSGVGGTPGTGTVSVDPKLDANFAPEDGSPLADAGDPDVIDGNESRSDIGRTGGIRNVHHRYHREHPLDVNDDGEVTPIDCLWIINRLNATPVGQLPSDSAPVAYWDTDDDGILANHDTLLVINRINAQIPYHVEYIAPHKTGDNAEEQLSYDGFHFATVIITPTGALVFRARGGGGRDAWGTSVYLAAYIGGEGSDAVGGHIDEITAAADGVYCRASGSISGLHGTSFGSWSWHGKILFDPVSFNVDVIDSGYDISLADILGNAGGELNLGRIASNRLVNVPLQELGGTGNTGDMQQIDVGTESDTYHWYPDVNETNYRTNDPTQTLEVGIIGDRNRVDTIAQLAPFQINVADKPTLHMSYSSRTPGVTIVWGGYFDKNQSTNFAADNIASLALVLRNSTIERQLAFTVQIHSTPIAN